MRRYSRRCRDAVESMLKTWPSNQQLDLMAYGHRSLGSCDDIEVLKASGTLDAAAMQKAVNALQPKGMTPITAFVRMGAEQLKFSERRATVILVSDGEEACNVNSLSDVPHPNPFNSRFALSRSARVVLAVTPLCYCPIAITRDGSRGIGSVRVSCEQERLPSNLPRHNKLRSTATGSPGNTPLPSGLNMVQLQ